MEMDSSRRSFDRSRELGLKRPRLTAEEPNARPFSLRPIGAGQNQVQSRYERDTDSNDPSRGGGYQPQPLPQHQQHQELVEQYRTALSELTFNSKPIITNLTIIAGENLHAAKSIASTICNNILEVPSDQKLPSLYLLDSIVKNIGRDYIKYFAARLPEVFCKAYKQVEPPIHASMRHLFGTWKGVFHPQMLQTIEKDLGFGSSTNGSSSNGSSAPATSRSDSQSQRPPHSIHVNPKYLERQRLQQSAMPKVMGNDMDAALVNSSEDIEKLDGPTGAISGRTWAGRPAKMQRSQRDPRIGPLQDKNNVGALYGDFEYGSDISRNSGVGLGRSGGKVTEQKPWSGVSSGGVADTVSAHRNGYPARQKLQSYPPPKSSNIDSQLSRRVGGMSTSWKNSEEEEFLWDSIDSRSTDQDASIVRKDLWTSDVSEKLDLENSFLKTLSREERNRPGALGTPSHSGLSDGYPATVSLMTSGSSVSRRGMGSQGRSSSYVRSPSLGSPASSSGAIGQQPNQSLRPPSPAARSPMRHHSPPVDVAQHPQMDSKTSQFSGKLSLGLSRYNDDSSKLPSDVKLGSLKRLQPHESKAASPPMISLQPRQLPQISPPISAEVSGHPIVSSAQDSAPEDSLPPSLDTSRQLSASTSSLLAAIAKSGGISVNAMITSLPGLGSQDKVPETSQTSSRALPGVTVSTDLSFPMLKSESSTVLATSNAATPAPTGASQVKIPKREPEENPNITKNSDPISSLLSSLVARGLISSSKMESPAPVPGQTDKSLLKVKQEPIAATPEPVSSASAATEIPVPAAADDVSIPEPVTESSDLPQLPAPVEDIKNLIGFEFKPEVIRKFHSSVIVDLFDELPYQCDICGMRLKRKGCLDRHLFWHASLNPEQRATASVSSKWYTHSSDWVAGRTGPDLYGKRSIKVEENFLETSEIVEPMVPADESQCACVLCGELFEDFYDIGKDEWMFKGAVYMTIPFETPTVGAESDSSFRGPIVHANCLSENSVRDLGLDNGVKMEEDG